MVERIKELVTEIQIPIIFGAITEVGGKYYNSAMYVSTAGEIKNKFCFFIIFQVTSCLLERFYILKRLFLFNDLPLKPNISYFINRKRVIGLLFF